MYVNAVQSARTMPIVSICAAPAPSTTNTLPINASARARNSARGGAFRSRPIVTSMTQTGYV